MSELTRLGVEAASALLARGEIASSELTEAYLARIAALDPTLHCYVATRVEEARADARASDARHARGARRGPLDGIPVALKDNIDVACMPTTNGLGTREGETPTRDAEVARRFRDAGAVILGKLNTSCSRGRRKRPSRTGKIASTPRGDLCEGRNYAMSPEPSRA